MNIRQKVEQLTAAQNEKLALYRKRRKFEVEKYVNLKCDLLNSYFEKCGLQTAIIAVSGGIDSAVVLGLLYRASQKGIIKQIIPITLPNYDSAGVTNQRESADDAQYICRIFNQKLYNIDISATVNSIDENLQELSLDLKSRLTTWAEGQLTPYVRLPYLCYCATLAADAGKPGCIIGTTNRDEGAFLGYVGKFSDGAVDAQMISDIHKSEVMTVARYLKIPQRIIDRTPKGDLYDASADEELFGATYDAVELHINERQTDKVGENLNNLHAYNSHKYRVGSPAVHLNLYESGTENGWPLDFEQKYWSNLKKQGDIIKPGFVSPLPFAKLEFDTPEEGKALSENEILQLKGLYSAGRKLEANINGYTSGGVKGSERASLYNIELAQVLWERLRPSLELLQKAEKPITDWNEGEIYRLVGINPLFRFIGYEKGGELVPHYDFAFESGGYKTLYSVVLCLTTNDSGATVFYEDPQIESWDKDLADKPLDWVGKVTRKFYPKAGSHLTFPHHMLHSGEKTNDFKLIIRTDILAERIL
jgi:NAD+ synthetase